MIKIRYFFALVCCMLCTVSYSQSSLLDTLQASIKTDSRRLERSLGRIKTDINAIRAVVSPLGEGDPIRWAQGMPGVTTGADGTTAMYVRGGNIGNNLFTLDGVPIYGYSHILGLTTIVPTDVAQSASLVKGGFDGDESNFTSAHIQILSKDPSDRQCAGFSANNFLLSTVAEGPISKKLSYITSFRLSPLGLEYRAVKGSFPSLFGGIDDLKTNVGDAYGKLMYRISNNKVLYGSFLGSLDRYGFNTLDESQELMSWFNMMGQIRYQREGKTTDSELSFSANRYGNSQQQDKLFRGEMNHLSLNSTLMEYSFKAGMLHRVTGGRLVISEGASLRLATFAPGQIGKETRTISTSLLTGWLQAEYKIPDCILLKAVGRINKFNNHDLLMSENYAKPWSKAGQHKDPEYSLSAKWSINRHFTIEASLDKLVQYYHTLEGLPVGWSLDMIVPTGETVLPEFSDQYSLGASARFGSHSLSIGAFHKKMDNLVYYKYSQAMFSGALAAWENHVELGDGLSYGLESLYEYQKKDVYMRVSYTLSNTTRENFPSFYEGKSFHARFDRRHVLNATASWKGFSATFILQSGNWENGEAETYEMPYLSGTWWANYYSGINNYHMPMVLRLDLGYQFKFNTGSLEHVVSLGVCNVTNHFNPFMLYFDTRDESWMEIALLPILPNFNWKILF